MKPGTLLKFKRGGGLLEYLGEGYSLLTFRGRVLSWASAGSHKAGDESDAWARDSFEALSDGDAARERRILAAKQREKTAPQFLDTSFVFGVPSTIKPLGNLPPGAQVEFRFGEDCLAVAYVTSGTYTWRRHDIVDCGDHWTLCDGRYVRPTDVEWRIDPPKGRREASFNVYGLSIDELSVLVVNGKRFYSVTTAARLVA